MKGSSSFNGALNNWNNKETKETMQKRKSPETKELAFDLAANALTHVIDGRTKREEDSIVKSTRRADKRVHTKKLMILGRKEEVLERRTEALGTEQF